MHKSKKFNESGNTGSNVVSVVSRRLEKEGEGGSKRGLEGGRITSCSPGLLTSSPTRTTPLCQLAQYSCEFCNPAESGNDSIYYVENVNVRPAAFQRPRANKCLSRDTKSHFLPGFACMHECLRRPRPTYTLLTTLIIRSRQGGRVLLTAIPICSQNDS